MLGRLIVIPAAPVLIIGVLSWAVPRGWKEILIFWRRDKNCLPSSRAFTAISFSDPRINSRRLSEKYGPLPSDPAQQTVLSGSAGTERTPKKQPCRTPTALISGIGRSLLSR